jgi:hypothetical protein
VAIDKAKKTVKDLSMLTKQLISEAGVTDFEVTYRDDVRNNDISANKSTKVDKLEAPTTYVFFIFGKLIQLG